MARKQQARSVAWAILLGVFAVLLAVLIFVVVLTFRAFSPLISGGEREGTISVGSVVGLEEEAALRALRGQGLAPKVLNRTLNDEQEAGKVFKQNPTEGQKVKRGRQVLLWVSLGRASFTIPDLAGEHIDSVQSKLVKAGLTLGSITKVYYEGVPSGRVLNQNPVAGSDFTSSVPVDVVVADSTNLPRVAVPDITDMPLTAAEDILARGNLHLAKVVYVADDTQPRGAVLKQTPAAGGEAALGSRVELEVALPAAELNSPVKTITLRIPVPTGPAKQRVRIKVYDALNTKGQVAYDTEHAPGDMVEKQLDLEGKATVQVFLNNMDKAWREDRL